MAFDSPTQLLPQPMGLQVPREPVATNIAAKLDDDLRWHGVVTVPGSALTKPLWTCTHFHLSHAKANHCAEEEINRRMEDEEIFK